jgi:hypothetical protein
VPLAWAGFAVNFASGVLLFMPKASTFLTEWPFQVKMTLIVAGGISLWFLLREVMSADRGASDDANGSAKIIATCCLIFWVGAIVAGRLIAYIR